MKRIAKIVSVLLAIIITLNLGSVQISAKDVFSDENAKLLSIIGMFRGSDLGFELERQPSRLEGLVMMLRITGREEEALSYNTNVTTFKDVPEWGMQYVQYAYDHGLTKGINGSEFGSNLKVDSKSYLTFVLRSLGYDDNKSDFSWATAEEKSIELGIIEAEISDFTRGDMVNATLQALHTRISGSEKTLLEAHVSSGFISEAHGTLLIAREKADALNGVNIMYPPSTLVGCVSDGVTDVTKELQAIIDYCAANDKALIVPYDEIFRVSQVEITNTDGFIIYGYGTLKRIDDAPKNTSMIKISKSNNLVIPILHTDGNVDSNLRGDGARVQEDSHSIRLRSCNNVTVGSIYDINPVGDGVYLNGVNNFTAELMSSISDVDSGRNGLSIISGDTIDIKKVISTNIGVAMMPGGVDLEPNENDEIHNVTIHNAIITTVATGLTVTASASGSVVDNINIAAQLYRTHSKENRSNDSAVFYKVTNSSFDVNIVQNVISDGVGMYYCDNVDVHMNISDVNWGLSVYDSSDFNITGNINQADRGAIRFRFGTVSEGTIKMNLSNSNLNNDDYYGKVHVYKDTVVENVTFSGDYSKGISGDALFMNLGTMTDCRMDDLNVSGFSGDKVIYGSGQTDLRD